MKPSLKPPRRRSLCPKHVYSVPFAWSGFTLVFSPLVWDATAPQNSALIRWSVIAIFSTILGLAIKDVFGGQRGQGFD
ncbi:hypothetical protein K470DRAFT_257936 [Piedraia hortae CBS 480.64]|uniref:Uncharacterized protein n=1 Tax=Piedraia hortae CBS 480.64 TaxID=1314780 RepID=A0A6A7BYP6_9PEZI|nr:hypothetical protein K470DRAFT_257936 [Piedraia hortae CBS 480.64]